MVAYRYKEAVYKYVEFEYEDEDCAISTSARNHPTHGTRVLGTVKRSFLSVCVSGRDLKICQVTSTSLQSIQEGKLRVFVASVKASLIKHDFNLF